MSTKIAPPSILAPGVSPWVASVIACLCSFMVVVDAAIVNIALPAMRDDLGLSSVGQQWVIDAYLLALGGCMLLAARASDLYGRRRILLAGLVLFTAASLVGGFATDGAMLIAARTVQGFGASSLATSTLAVIVMAYPDGPGRERAISLWAACAAIAAAAGVTIGGVVTAFAGWRWVMFVNVPVGCLLLAMVATGLATQPQRGKRARLDVAGAMTIVLAMTTLIYGVTQAAESGWTSGLVRGCLATSLGLILLFCLIEHRSENPLIPLGLFRLRNISVGIVLVLGLGATLTSSMYFLSLILQQLGGYGPFETGLSLLPMALTLAATAMVSRRLREAGFTRLPFLGGLLAAIGLFWLGWLPAHPNFMTQLLGPSLLVGGGLGLMIMSATQAVLAGVPAADSSLAAGLQNTARQLGGAIGVAGLVTVSNHVADRAVRAGAETALAHLSGYQAAFWVAGAVSAVAALASLALIQKRSGAA